MSVFVYECGLCKCECVSTHLCVHISGPSGRVHEFKLAVWL